MSKRFKLLIDADFFAYRAASVNSTVVEWEDGIVEAWGDVNKAYADFCAHVEDLKKLRKDFKNAELVMFFTAPDNWRKEVLPTYKASRSSKPVVYWKLVERIKENFHYIEKPSLEGDDCLGIVNTNPSLVDADDTCIISVDKDFNTIPGKFLWFDSFSHRHEYKEISEQDADWWHMLQTLMGDVTDGYAGCPGLGRTGAVAFLEEPYIACQKERVLKSGPRKGESEWLWTTRPLEAGETLWDGVVSLFNKAGLTEEDALVQARVARILRASDYDWEAEKVILWSPNRNKEDGDVFLQES